MIEAVHSTAEVRAHYAELATYYDAKANKACKRAYEDLVREHLSDSARVIELGAGSSSLLNVIDAPFKVACDLSVDMLSVHRHDEHIYRLAGDAQQMACLGGAFDGAFCINMLEHVPDPRRVVAEMGRLLVPGGRFLALTPNGDVEWLLDLLERLHLKLPEGPHKFLDFEGLAKLAGEAFNVIEHKRLLAFPVGPPAFVKVLDKLLLGKGLFQYILLEKG